MPKKFMKRKGFKKFKKGPSKYSKKNNPNQVVANYPMNQVFPRSYVCKMKYSVIVPVATGQLSRDYTFNMNSCHDPDLTSTGGQPRFFDQLSAIYGVYRVIGSKIRARYMPNQSSFPATNHWLIVGANTDSTSQTGLTYGALAEKPLIKSTINNAYGNRSVITNYLPISKVVGVKPTVVRNDDRYSAAVTTDPSARAYWHVVVGTLDETSTLVQGQIAIDLTMYTVFERPITPGQS